MSTSRTYGNITDASAGFELTTSVGVEAQVGLGYATVMEVGGGTSLSMSTNASISNDGEYIESTTFGSRFETNSDPIYQGSSMDVYVGKSKIFFLD